MLIEDLLQLSPFRLVTARRETSIGEAARRMAKFNIGVIVVMNGLDRLVGVLSERDILTAIGKGATHIEEHVVADLMTDVVVSVSPSDTLVDALLKMNNHGIRHLIALDGNRPVGVISMRDVLRVFARQYLETEEIADGQFKQNFIEALAA